MLAQHADVSASCVATFTDGSGETALMAVIEPHDATRSVDPATSRSSFGNGCQTTLCHHDLRWWRDCHAHPSARWTARPPQRRLPPFNRCSCQVRRLVEPTTDLERDMLVLWQNLLGVEQLGVTDDFFDVGGHSLLATDLMLEIEARFGAELNLATIFEARTVRALCEALGRRIESQAALMVVLTQDKSNGVLYCLHSMSRYVPLSRELDDTIAMSVVMVNGARQLKPLMVAWRPACSYQMGKRGLCRPDSSESQGWPHLPRRSFVQRHSGH